MKMKEHNTTMTERQIEIVRVSEGRERRGERKGNSADWQIILRHRWLVEENPRRIILKFVFKFSFVQINEKNFILSSFLARTSSATSTGDRRLPISMLEEANSPNFVDWNSYVSMGSKCRSVCKTNLNGEEKKPKATAGWNSSGASRRCSMLFSDANAEKTNEVFG